MQNEILKMNGGEIAGMLNCQTLNVRRVPDKDSGGSAIWYNPLGELIKIDRTLEEAPSIIGVPKEYFIVGNIHMRNGGDAIAEPIYLAVRNGAPSLEKGEVLALAAKAYDGLRPKNVTEQQVEVYLGLLEKKEFKNALALWAK